MTSDSSTAARTGHSWIDEAFLWTAGSLAVIAVAATAPPPRLWTTPPRSPTAGRPPDRAPPRFAAPDAPPLIRFQAPAPGYRVISPFGVRQLPWEAHGRLHRGVDIAAPSGTPVRATSDGVVVRIAADPGYGRFVELKHAGGLVTLYAHLSRIAVRPGEAVTAGTQVGLMGSTGSSTGAHVHFEIHDAQGRPLNPELFLGRVFRTSSELPLKRALRAPKGLRVAYVSVIPAAKRALMAERAAEQAATPGGEDAAPPRRLPHAVLLIRARAAAEAAARSAGQDDLVGELLATRAGADGRVHARIIPAG